MAKTRIRLTGGSGLLILRHPTPSKPKSNKDKYGKVSRMNTEELRCFIKSIEKKKISYDYQEYMYAKERLRELIRKEESDRKKELEKVKKEEKKRLREVEKIQKLNTQKNRKAELSLLENTEIYKNVLEDYEACYGENWNRLTEENRAKKINAKKSALSNIDFVKGKIRPQGFEYMPVRITYLTDKGVILLRGLYNGVYVFYSPDKEPGCLTTVSGFSKEKTVYPMNTKAYLTTLNKSFQKMFGEPTVCRFPFDFFKEMVSKYYLYYEERESKGTEKTNIPCSLSRSSKQGQ